MSDGSKNRTVYHKPTPTKMEAREQDARDRREWKKNLDHARKLEGEWAVEFVAAGPSGKSKRNPCSPMEALEILAMRPGTAVPQLYPYEPLHHEAAIMLSPGSPGLVRRQRDKAVERAEVIRLVAIGLMNGLNEPAAIRSAAIHLGIKAANFPSAVRQARHHWASRRRCPPPPWPKRPGYSCSLHVPALSEERDIAFQLAAAESAQLDAIRFITRTVDRSWLRWMDEPDRKLRQEIGALARKYRIGDRLSDWTGRSEAEWDQAAKSVVRAAIGALEMFTTINGRIAPRYDRGMYILARMDEYFRWRLKPEPDQPDQWPLLNMAEYLELDDLRDARPPVSGIKMIPRSL